MAAVHLLPPKAPRLNQIHRLEKMAARLRRNILRMVIRGKGAHIGAALSIVEILTVLYDQVLNVHSSDPHDPRRDRFILSKGHAGIALYAILAEKGFFPKTWLDTYGQAGTKLGGHPDMHKVPGVEASTGALGHGFGFGLGQALAGKMDRANYRVFALLGDGECQEGSIWEAALFAPQHRLDNLTVIIDHNHLQAMDTLDRIVSLGNLAQKWRAFGWEVVEVNGHDLEQLVHALGTTPAERGKPTCVIAHTIKGKGISYMENAPLWHYRMPNEEELAMACRELDINDIEGPME